MKNKTELKFLSFISNKVTHVRIITTSYEQCTCTVTLLAFTKDPMKIVPNN